MLIVESKMFKLRKSIQNAKVVLVVKSEKLTALRRRLAPKKWYRFRLLPPPINVQN